MVVFMYRRSLFSPSLIISASTSAAILLTSKPTLPELLILKTSSGSTANIVEQIGTHYSILGPLLLNDDTGAVTSAITNQHHHNAYAINQEILTRWLQGQGKTPVSWSTFTDVLKEVGLSELSQMIQDSLIRSTTATSGEMDTSYPTIDHFVVVCVLCMYIHYTDVAILTTDIWASAGWGGGGGGTSQLA